MTFSLYILYHNYIHESRLYTRIIKIRETILSGADYLYTTGIGCSSIARILNQDGVLPPSEYKNQHGIEYKNQHYKIEPLWRYYSINRIISDEVYIGNLVQNKAHSISYKTKTVNPTDKTEWIRVENTHEPIVDINTWNVVQGLKEKRAVRCTWKNDGSYSGINIFSKKLFCSRCGGIVKISLLFSMR